MAQDDYTIESLDRSGPDHTRRAPPELLSAIFSIVCSDPITASKSMTQKFALAAVCRRWHQLIWSFPQLWSKFVAVPRSCDAGVVHLLKLHLENVGEIPISVLLGFQFDRRMESDGDLEIYNTILQLIFSQYSTRIGSLGIRIIDKSIWESIYIYSRHSSFPKLQSLDLEFRYDVLSLRSELRLWYSLFPNLRSLHLAGNAFFPAFFSSTNLTELGLISIHPDDAIYTLALFPSLTSFAIFSGLGSHRIPEVIPTLGISDGVILPNLRRFTWRVASAQTDTSLIKHIHIPTLNHLEWTWGSESGENWRCWEQFFRNIGRINGSIELSLGVHLGPLMAKLLKLFSCQRIRRLKICVRKLKNLDGCLPYLTYSPTTSQASFLGLESLEISLQEMINQVHIFPFLRFIAAILQSRRSPNLATSHIPLSALRIICHGVQLFPRTPNLLDIEKELHFLRDLKKPEDDFGKQLEDLMYGGERSESVKERLR